MTADDPRLFERDYRYQLVLDFIQHKAACRHYKKLGARKTVQLTEASLKTQLVKPECLHTVSI
jgi:hypothetical protein